MYIYIHIYIYIYISFYHFMIKYLNRQVSELRLSCINLILFLSIIAMLTRNKITKNKNYTFISCNLAEICSTAKFLVPIKVDLHTGHICSCTLHALHMWCPFTHWIFTPCVASKHTGHWSNSSNTSHH